MILRVVRQSATAKMNETRRAAFEAKHPGVATDGLASLRRRAPSLPFASAPPRPAGPGAGAGAGACRRACRATTTTTAPKLPCCTEAVRPLARREAAALAAFVRRLNARRR
jgi:hypothetical protein